MVYRVLLATIDLRRRHRLWLRFVLLLIISSWLADPSSAQTQLETVNLGIVSTSADQLVDNSENQQTLSTPDPLNAPQELTNESLRSPDSETTTPPPTELPEQPSSLPEITNLTPDTSLPDAALPSLGQDTINVRQFIVEDSTVFSEDELAEVVEPFLGEVTFAQLLEARSAITQLYIRHGYITSGAYLPEQEDVDVTNGTVLIRVVEGYLNAPTINVIPTTHDPDRFQCEESELIPNRYTGRLEPAPDRLDSSLPTNPERLSCNIYLSDEYILSQLDIDTEHPFNINRLQDSLRLLQQNSMISRLSSTLSVGARPGTSDLTINITQRPISRTFGRELVALQGFQFSVDNNRSPSVGSTRFRVEYDFFPQIYQYEDELRESATVGMAFTEGSQAVDFNLQLEAPEWSASFRLGDTFSTITEEPFSDLDINSPSRFYELVGRWRATSSSREEFAIGGGILWQQSNTSVRNIGIPITPGAEETGRSRSSSLQGFLEWTRRSTWEASSIRSELSLGVGLFATVNDDLPDSRFLIWRNQAQWIARLAPNTLFLLRTDVQLADDSLLTINQFGLGGQASVRGYRQDELIADNGIFASAELRLPIISIPESGILVQITPFIDFGNVWNNNDQASLNTETLWSVGVGLRTDFGRRFSARIDWGIPMVPVESRGNSLQDNGIYFSVIWNPF